MVQKRRQAGGSKPSLVVKSRPRIARPPPAPGPLAHPIYTTAQVAAALQLSRKTILRAIAQGHLEARKAGKLYLIAQDAVQRYWESLPLATTAPKTVGRPKKTSSAGRTGH